MNISFNTTQPKGMLSHYHKIQENMLQRLNHQKHEVTLHTYFKILLPITRIVRLTLRHLHEHKIIPNISHITTS
jgi:hypothetical protein